MAKASSAMRIPFASYRVALCPDERPERRNAPPVGIGRGVKDQAGTKSASAISSAMPTTVAFAGLGAEATGAAGFWILHKTPGFDPGVDKLAADVATVPGSCDDRDFRVDHDDGDGSLCAGRHRGSENRPLLCMAGRAAWAMDANI
jgi:hypothetical protein